MRGGRIAESGPAEQVLEAPRDAYTRVLLDAVPGTRLASAKEARA
jgi:peptide/nickel transport system ATP-binding protein